MVSIVVAENPNQPVARNFNSDDHVFSDMKIRVISPISATNVLRIFCFSISASFFIFCNMTCISSLFFFIKSI